MSPKKSFNLIKLKKTKSNHGWFEVPKAQAEHDGLILSLERTMPFSSTLHNVGIITVKKNQKDEAEWSNNLASPQLIHFLEILGDEFDDAGERSKRQYKTSWKGLEFDVCI